MIRDRRNSAVRTVISYSSTAGLRVAALANIDCRAIASAQKVKQHGSHQNRRRQQAQWRHSYLWREKCSAASDDRLPPHDDTLTLENVPHLADVEQLIRILSNHGVDYSVNGRREHQNGAYSRTIHFTARNIVDTVAPYELVSKMRASFWVIGPLLARMGEATVSLPAVAPSARVRLTSFLSAFRRSVLRSTSKMVMPRRARHRAALSAHAIASRRFRSAQPTSC